MRKLDTCYLHIGMHKTGTTALQQVFKLHSNELQQQDIYYPLCIKNTIDDSHNTLGMSIMCNNILETKKHLNALEQEINSSTCKNVLISSEVLEKAPLHNQPSFILFLNFLNKTFKSIKVIYCLRDEKAVCTSYFKQLVVGSQFNETPKKHIQNFLQNEPTYNKIYTLWKEIEKVTVYSFWYTLYFSNNLDYFNQIMNTSFSFSTPGLINPTVDGNMLQLLHYSNSLHVEKEVTVNACKYIKRLLPFTPLKLKQKTSLNFTDFEKQFLNLTETSASIPALNQRYIETETLNLYNIPKKSEVNDIIAELLSYNICTHFLTHLL